MGKIVVKTGDGDNTVEAFIYPNGKVCYNENYMDSSHFTKIQNDEYLPLGDRQLSALAYNKKIGAFDVADRGGDDENKILDERRMRSGPKGRKPPPTRKKFIGSRGRQMFVVSYEQITNEEGSNYTKYNIWLIMVLPYRIPKTHGDGDEEGVLIELYRRDTRISELDWLVDILGEDATPIGGTHIRSAPATPYSAPAAAIPSDIKGKSGTIGKLLMDQAKKTGPRLSFTKKWDSVANKRAGYLGYILNNASPANQGQVSTVLHNYVGDGFDYGSVPKLATSMPAHPVERDIRFLGPLIGGFRDSLREILEEDNPLIKRVDNLQVSFQSMYNLSTISLTTEMRRHPYD